MPHTHYWQVQPASTLTLPDVDGYFEQAISYVCRCGAYQVLSGLWHHASRARSLTQWQEVARQERRQQTPLAQMAAREERRKLRC